jgi:hypothetical protein
MTGIAASTRAATIAAHRGMAFPAMEGAARDNIAAPIIQTATNNASTKAPRIRPDSALHATTEARTTQEPTITDTIM